jgi:alpha-L-fucosidase
MTRFDRRRELLITRRELLASGGAAALASNVRAAELAPTRQSLAADYRVPDWFRDAQLGFWAHWGPQCQPEFGDWYARLL